MEQLDLTTPVTVPPKTTVSYKVVSLTLSWEISIIDIILRSNLGVPLSHRYTGQQAIDMMKTLNTANLTNNSMHKRILNKLSIDGIIPGTVTGTPDGI